MGGNPGARLRRVSEGRDSSGDHRRPDAHAAVAAVAPVAVRDGEQGDRRPAAVGRARRRASRRPPPAGACPRPRSPRCRRADRAARRRAAPRRGRAAGRRRARRPARPRLRCSRRAGRARSPRSRARRRCADAANTNRGVMSSSSVTVSPARHVRVSAGVVAGRDRLAVEHASRGSTAGMRRLSVHGSARVSSDLDLDAAVPRIVRPHLDPAERRARVLVELDAVVVTRREVVLQRARAAASRSAGSRRTRTTAGASRRARPGRDGRLARAAG